MRWADMVEGIEVQYYLGGEKLRLKLATWSQSLYRKSGHPLMAHMN